MCRCILFIPLAFAIAGCSSRPDTVTSDNRIKRLEAEVEQQRQDSEKAVAAYAPKAVGRIDDFGAPAVDILRQRPGVSAVAVLVRADKPSYRVIHLRNWHYVARESYAVDFEQAIGRPLTDDDYRQHLLEVHLVQLQHTALLRCLIRHHGLKHVLCEGLTPKTEANYRSVIAALRDMDGSLKKLKNQRDSLRQKNEEIDTAIAGLESELNEQLVPYGAVGRLAVAGEIDVLPLDDEEFLDGANPVRDGKVELDPKRVEARQDAQVRAALKSGPCSVLILGGNHDLSTSVRRLGGGTVEYVRVTTSRFAQVAEDR